jgi:periplasmic divalent cation tolerance protein
MAAAQASVPSEFCLVLVTVPNETLATTIAHELLNQKLAACVNSFPVRSIYTWEGEIQQEHEYQLVIKTQSSAFEPLSTVLKRLHPYELPEMLAIPIVQGFHPYLNWLRDSTSP